jgi:hypothetical protein
MATRTSTAQTARQTLQQQGAEAIRSLREALHLPANLNDTTILGTALARAAAREVRRNAQFASELRREYDDLTATNQSARRRAGGQKQELPPLVPIRTDLGFRKIDPFAPPDPHWLTQVYGLHQLARALHDYSLDDLKRASAIIEAQHPGTKPRSKSSKQSVIDYIVRYSQD